MLSKVLLTFSAFFLFLGIAQPQSPPVTCATGAINPPLRAEGIAEVVGDILINCSGASPGAMMSLNLTVFLNVAVTNRVSSTGVTDVLLTVDSGSGPTPASVPSVLQGSNGVSFNGFSFTVPPSGQVN